MTGKLKALLAGGQIAHRTDARYSPLGKQANKKDIETKYLLNSSVYVPALIPAEKANTVILVLGANVMVEYSLEEAKKLLNKNLELGTKNLAQLEVDNDFVNDQIVTTEVNMARIHNWAIQQKEKLKN